MFRHRSSISAELAEGEEIPKYEPEKPKGRNSKPITKMVNTDIRKILDSEGKPLSAENQEKIQQLIDILNVPQGDTCDVSKP